MWRPEGWNNPHDVCTFGNRYSDYEDGADDMLKALEKIDCHIKIIDKEEFLVAPAFNFNIGYNGEWVKGKFVFIPSEVKQS